MSARERNKGNVLEREIVKRHEEIGVRAERYPLSGASRFRGKGHDVDLYAFGMDQPLAAEVKGRKTADGFRLLERWLGDNDVLFLRRNRADPLVVLPWAVWARLIKGGDDGISKILQAVRPAAKISAPLDGDASRPARRVAHRQARA